jgi:hypothetical protein
MSCVGEGPLPRVDQVAVSNSNLDLVEHIRREAEVHLAADLDAVEQRGGQDDLHPADLEPGHAGETSLSNPCH